MEKEHIKKNLDELELRMYNLAIYNISGIQAGIQSYHAGMEYAVDIIEHLIAYSDPEYAKEFLKWAKEWKTVIIKNGGTSNSGEKGIYGFPATKGSLNTYYDMLLEQNIKTLPFYEPDINNALTSICFIVDERVWDKKSDGNYPDYNSETADFYDMSYDEWVDYIGGERNLFLRNVIQPLPLASN